MKKKLNEGNQIHNFISSSGSGTVINCGSGSDFLTSSGSGSTSQNVTVPTVPVPRRCCMGKNIYLSPSLLPLYSAPKLKQYGNNLTLGVCARALCSLAKPNL